MQHGRDCGCSCLLSEKFGVLRMERRTSIQHRGRPQRVGETIVADSSRGSNVLRWWRENWW